MPPNNPNWHDDELRNDFAAARDAVGEEPIAASGWQFNCDELRAVKPMKRILPPLVTLSDEEPIAAGGWSF
jgi:hypothetical protein